MLKRKLTALGMSLALTLMGVSMSPAQAQAPAQQKEEPERYGPFFYLPSEPNLLIYVGAVSANDLLHMKKALREHPTISTLILQNNGGGLVHIGLVVAEEVYERGLNTYIPKDSYCASACAFVFFAGRQRLAEGRLGRDQGVARVLQGHEFDVGDGHLRGRCRLRGLQGAFGHGDAAGVERAGQFNQIDFIAGGLVYHRGNCIHDEDPSCNRASLIRQQGDHDP